MVNIYIKDVLKYNRVEEISIESVNLKNQLQSIPQDNKFELFSCAHSHRST